MRQLLKVSLVWLVTAVAAPAEPVTILALGDSLTQGYGLPPQQGFVPQMQAWLQARGEDVNLVNAGVSGDTTAGGAARLDWSLNEEVDAVVVALGGNDILRGIAPEAARANLDSILSRIVARNLPVLLVGQRTSGNFGPEYQTAFDAIYPDLAQAHSAHLFPDFLAGLSRMEDRNQVMTTYMQADGLHPNAAGVALVVEAMGPALQALVTEVRTADTR